MNSGRKNNRFSKGEDEAKKSPNFYFCFCTHTSNERKETSLKEGTRVILYSSCCYSFTTRPENCRFSKTRKRPKGLPGKEWQVFHGFLNSFLNLSQYRVVVFVHQRFVNQVNQVRNSIFFNAACCNSCCSNPETRSNKR